MKDTLGSLLAALGLELEPWMASAFAVVLALALMPAWRRNFRTKQARKRIQAMSHADVERRRALHQEVLMLVDGNPFGLVVVIEEAIKRGLPGLAREGLERLEATGRNKDHARRLRLQVTGERPTTPEAEALAVERLREAGLEQAATERLQAARARWPSHPSLR